MRCITKHSPKSLSHGVVGLGSKTTILVPGNEGSNEHKLLFNNWQSNCSPCRLEDPSLSVSLYDLCDARLWPAGRRFQPPRRQWNPFSLTTAPRGVQFPIDYLQRRPQHCARGGHFYISLRSASSFPHMVIGNITLWFTLSYLERDGLFKEMAYI